MSESEHTVRLFAHTEIDIKRARTIFRQFGAGTVLKSLSRIPEGSSTSNYIASLADGNRFLLKIYPENGGNGALETAAYRYAAQYVKVPEMLLYDDSLMLFHRPYAVMQFVDGVGLGKYIINNNGLPASMARTIGKRLALLHGRGYSCMALLDASLNVRQDLLPIHELHAFYLNGAPGKFINPEIRDDVLGFLRDHSDIVNSLSESIVFNHGDFSPGNMIVDGEGEIWFIDFEYCLAAPPYYDIGKFFRDRPGVSDTFSPEIYAAFRDGYNSCARKPLQENWHELSRLMDMTSLLHLLNYESAACWAGEIEEMIKKTMMILKDE